MNKIHWSSILSIPSIIYTCLGVFCAIVALQGFMIPNHFLDGGITGISILVHEVTHINISIFLLLFNLPFVVMGYKKMGITFATQVLIAVGLLAIFMNIIQIDPILKHGSDKILIAVFGGLLMGLAVGFVIKGGGVIDGFEVVAHYTNKKLGLSTGEIVLFVNSILFLLAAFAFNLETALYSILTYYTAVKVSDYVVDGFEEYTALTIVSENHEEVKRIIVKDFKKAISVYKGERGYLPTSFEVRHDCDIVMTIATRLEVHKLKEAITEVDPKAFFYVQRIKEVTGGVVKRTRKH